MKPVLLAAALLAPSLAGAEIFEVTDDANGVPQFTVTEAPELTAIPEIAGNANEGFEYGQIWSGLDGYMVFEGRVAPGGHIVSYEGPDTYIGYIISGQGTIGIDGPDGQLVSRFEFGPGDTIVFGPGTMHHWVNGDEELVFIGVQRLPGTE